ncbi:hypothetical protein Hanom_Chr12g01132951 [Helianthus anomalus]
MKRKPSLSPASLLVPVITPAREFKINSEIKTSTCLLPIVKIVWQKETKTSTCSLPILKIVWQKTYRD